MPFSTQLLTPLARHVARLLLGAVAMTACSAGEAPLAARADDAVLAQGITDATLRRERAALIRDSAASVGVSNGVLFVGIGQSETGLSHCDSEVGYGCPGPASPSCGGEPILAGGADGPCSAEQGGLGMFQFDAGTYADTLATYGEDVLTIEGNARFAVEYMIARILISEYVDGVETREDAIAWINAVEPGGNQWDAWLTSVTHYYNGCTPSGCGVFDQRYESYGSATLMVLDEMGADFWADIGELPEPPVCQPVPAEGRVIEETDDCYEDGGPAQYLRTAEDGSAGRLRWTDTTDSDRVDNFAIWHLNFAVEGDYRVEVYTDADWGFSRQARYLLTHAGELSEVVIDQRAVDGFQPLGVFHFAAGAGQELRLNDNTGEPWSAEAPTHLVFDAVRLTPADAEEPPVEEPPIGQEGEGEDDEPLRVRPGPLGMSCASSPAGTGLWLSVLTLGLRSAGRARGRALRSPPCTGDHPS